MENNKIANAIATLGAKCSTVSKDKLEDLRGKLDMALDEYVCFQELKSVASIDGKLTLDEAQLVYTYLGNTPEHFNAQPIEVKVVLTQLFKELLGARIARKI